jgi:cell division protein FtsN
MPRPISRDYKRSRTSSGFDLTRWKEFLGGLALGLGVAVASFAYQHNALEKAAAAAAVAPRPEPRPTAARTAAKDAGAAADASAEETKSYDFYEMLPKFEVVVPEKEREVKRDIPNSPIDRPGVYVLQAGSYRKLEDAQRIRQQLSLQGIDATVQRVAVDADVWHRVRIGPLRDLAEINKMRGKLRHAELDAIVIRVGD